jgi:predicted lipoprotein with Yx(FWY)xxD motif
MVARSKAAFLVAPICAAVLVAGCGSSGAAAGTSNTTQGTGRPTGPVTIKAVTGRDGTYLTDASGRALYMWVGDDPGKSNCSSDCARAWPPVVTASASAPRASGDARPANLGTITRSDGAKQVTYKGHPLYYFVVDSGPGTTKGQGSSSFGARWWLVAPSGAAITVNGSSSVAPPTAY